MIIALPTNAERVAGEGGSQQSCETDGGLQRLQVSPPPGLNS
jgi:hypothetical protein